MPQRLVRLADVLSKCAARPSTNFSEASSRLSVSNPSGGSMPLQDGSPGVRAVKGYIGIGGFAAFSLYSWHSGDFFSFAHAVSVVLNPQPRTCSWS